MEAELLNLSDEEYVVQRAKRALKIDPVAAKAWMITAKTLYPNNFAVQFEAYKIEKEAGHLKEAAKYFSDLLGKFQREPEFWQEIENVTAALRYEHDASDTDKHFLCEMFKHISFDVQHQLLLFTAEHCEDTMEHCKLLLLLLQRFPNAISTHGPRLVDTLLSAEKHSHASNQPVNPYRKLLVCDVLPLLSNENMKIEFSSKLLFKLLHKSTEFYLCSLEMSKSSVQDPNISVDDPWKKLFAVIELTGRHLGWESYLITFSPNWSKESYWQKILTFCQTHKTSTPEDQMNTKQLIYCLTIFFLNCLYDYNLSLSPEAPPGQVQTSFFLVEAFTDPNLPTPVTEPKSKRRKGENDSTPLLTVDKSENRGIIGNFLMAVNCWDLFHSSDNLQREFSKLNTHIKLDAWLFNFLIDYSIYKGLYDDALIRLQQINDSHLSVAKNIRHSSILYLRKSYTSSFEPLLLAIQAMPLANRGTLSTQLNTGGTNRHLHFLPLTQMAVLQYCVKLLCRCIKDNLMKQSNSYNELAIGNILVLLQFDWPQEEDLLPLIIEQIRQRGSFSYLLFQAYIINVDILEELTYLWTEQGGQISLDILPHLGQRRIGTRGADKGVKEEIKYAIKRQIARSNEPLDLLIMKFISQERGHILQSLM
ncbi:integrator complex subunit 10 [Photinus pyralis]|nr:integrator complex subunit 10 [Photinus pyralis]